MILSYRSRVPQQLELANLPGLVKPRFQRTVDPEHSEPALARDCRDPIILLAGQRLRPEIEIDRAVLVNVDATLVVLARKLLDFFRAR